MQPIRVDFLSMKYGSRFNTISHVEFLSSGINQHMNLSDGNK